MTTAVRLDSAGLVRVFALSLSKKITQQKNHETVFVRIQQKRENTLLEYEKKFVSDRVENFVFKCDNDGYARRSLIRSVCG